MRRRTFALLLLAIVAVATIAAAQESDDVRLEYRSVTMFNQHLYFGTFSRPHGVVYDSEHGEVWVADSGNGLIGIYRPDGAEIFSFSSKQYLRDPVRMALLPKGRLAVVEGDHGHIRLFNYRGDYIGDMLLPGIADKLVIGAIASDSDGDLYIGDNRSAQIFVYRADGTLKQQFGSRGTDEGQFRAISGITVGKDGTVYVADAQSLSVQLFDDQGNFIRGWGKHEMGAENFSLPSGIAVDSKGHVLVSDELRHQVKIFSSEGRFLGQFGGLGDHAGELSFPTDLAVDDHDRIYVTERQTARVQVFAPVPAP